MVAQNERIGIVYLTSDNKNIRKILAIVIAVLAIILASVYYFFDPSDVGWMPRCLWKVLTDTDCPGCGSQRMAHALMHGDIIAAWHANAYALCMIPVIIFLFWLEFRRERHPGLYALVHKPAMMMLLVASVLV
ncbi:MAG: DUF2752 domain-containing protein, partial [Muribaculaceae bacterium]|nr:DUF2752 domain-containing protein [Muribaculaceae bacterium]